ncbi:phage tail protein [Empedobacter falsenii]|uniref:phage tail protein n=1 Tax=Empedobacter falsenii TaxID=343874 RepID=UPI002576630C|nr:phage tail protein [Empedobacter falsenii]MDM1061949.1 phage tail protein [Empedobacter falsenii]
MYYNIKRNNQTIASVVAEGTYTAQIMGEEVVNMSFTLSESVEFLIGDYVEIYGQSFILNLAPEEEKISSIQFKYTLQFESVKYELGKIQLLFPDSSDTLSISDFSVMGDARRVLELIIQNANRVQNNWKLGIVDDTETKNFSFSAHNLLTALTMLADEFDNEFWIDKDKTIHFTTKKEFSGLTLQYGINKGLRSLYRSRVDSSNIVTRLFAYGSEKNISSEYRNYSKRLKMDVPYLEANVDKFGIIEHTEMFDDVYPNRKGKVTEINSDNFLQFSDSELDFDLNSSDVLIPNTTVKVTFNTGQLAGYTFEVKEHGFNFNTKTFELQLSEQEKAITVPSELMRPAVGDEYVLTDIIMPLQYITEAESELKTRSEEYLIANCLPRLQYNVVSDPFYFEAQNIDVVLGKTIKMIDADFNLDADIRVIRLTKNLQDQYDVSFELADEVQVSRIVREYLDDQAWQNQVINHQQKVDRNIRRNYLFSREILGNVFDGEGYFDPEKIKPLSIETKMLSVGARSQQFAIKNAKLTIVDNQTIYNDAGQIVHFTIEDKERVWNILESTISNIKDTFNYIYLKCQRNGNNANFVVTTEQIKVDQDPVYFYFEYGFLSSIIEGFRRIRTSYGFTDVNGGEITSGRVIGQNGELFIDIDNREIIGKVKFLENSEAYDQIYGGINIGGEQLLLSTSTQQQGYDLDEEKKKRYAGVVKDYTFSVDVILDKARTICLYAIGKKIDNTGESLGYKITPVEIAGKKVRIDVVFACDISVYKKMFFVVKDEVTDEDLNLEFYQPKLELGKFATDYSEAGWDVKAFNENRIKEIEEKSSWISTDIVGNIIATGMAMVGNVKGANAGISGFAENGKQSVRFWAGAKASDRANAVFRVLDDGSVYAENAYIKGEVHATSGTFTGRIEAKSGYIGGLTLQDKLLTTTDVNSGIWFTYENEDYTSSIKVGNNIGEGIKTHDGFERFPFLVIESQAKKNITPWISYKSGIYLDIKTYNNEYMSYPAIEVKNGHFSGLAFEVESVLSTDMIGKNTDMCYISRRQGFPNEVYLPDNPRIGKILTIINPIPEIGSVLVKSNRYSIASKWLHQDKQLSFSNTMMLVFIGNSWITIVRT